MEDEPTESDREASRQAVLVEAAVVLVSAVLTVSLLGYVGWQLIAAPTAPPQAHVTGTHTTADGRVVVTVELDNPQDVGLDNALVSVSCRTPPVGVSFRDVPAHGAETAEVVCPTGTNRSVSIAYWTEA